MSESATVTLADGRAIELREPRAAELRGIKILDVLQMDVAAHAPLIARISELTEPEIYALSLPDLFGLMTEVVGFFGTAAESMTASRTPGP